MSEVRLRSVSYAELSGLRHEVAVVDGRPFETPEFLVIRYFGSYRDGAEGEPDAKYILAAAAAARQAWWSYSTILDFRELEYHWGDNMHWVTQIGWDPGTACTGHWSSWSVTVPGTPSSRSCERVQGFLRRVA